jgi:hypothetical protein
MKTDKFDSTPTRLITTLLSRTRLLVEMSSVPFDFLSDLSQQPSQIHVHWEDKIEKLKKK